MNKKTILLLLLAQITLSSWAQENAKAAVDQALNAWHQAAAAADYQTYFNGMTVDGVFIGTDATENWQNADFRAFSKPYFDRGKAWSFKAVERNIYVDEAAKLAWFDELLDTRFGISRGSGVMRLENGSWKVAHYVLSVTVPNDDIDALIDLKKDTDSLLLKKLTEKQ